ncbi:MAG: chemotaxis protein CheW [Sedimenticola sp.]|nr:chemotaxis protein CheW [Sedimenticola sp.]
MSEVESGGEVRGVLLPLRQGQLLLPNAAVCEVVSYRQPDPLEGDGPGWVLGRFNWRNHAMPLVSYEALLDQEEGEIGHRARVAICNTLSGDTLMPYIGILLNSAPHLVRITEQMIETQAGVQEAPMVKAAVSVNGVAALVPDLDALEAALADLK